MVLSFGKNEQSGTDRMAERIETPLSCFRPLRGRRREKNNVGRVRNNPDNVYDKRSIVTEEIVRNPGNLENPIDENGYEEVCPAHSGKDQSGHSENGPESHFQFAIGFLCLLDGHGEGKPSADEAESGKSAEDDEKDVVGHLEAVKGEGQRVKNKWKMEKVCPLTPDNQ
jgi:hypothetical protein